MLGLNFKGTLNRQRYFIMSLWCGLCYGLLLALVWFLATHLSHYKSVGSGKLFSALLDAEQGANQTETLGTLVQSAQADPQVQALLNTLGDGTGMPPDVVAQGTASKPRSASDDRPKPTGSVSQTILDASRAALLGIDPRVSDAPWSIYLGYLLNFYFFLQFLSLSWRRTQDFRFSGLFNLLLFVPWVNYVWMVLLSCIPSVPLDNFDKKQALMLMMEQARHGKKVENPLDHNRDHQI